MTSKAFLAAALLLVATAARGADFYVAPTGSDANDGLSPETAVATITRAAALIANPGDRVLVAPGTYVEGDISPARGGLERDVELIADTDGSRTGSAPGAVVVVPPPGVGTGFLLLGHSAMLIEGFTVMGGGDAGIQVRPTSAGMPSAQITLRGNTLLNGERQGIDVRAQGRVVIEANRVEGNASSGISVSGDGLGDEETPPLSLLLSNNVVVGNGIPGNGHGVFVAAAADGVLQNNEIAGNGQTGITLRAVARMLLVNNLVHGNGAGCVADTVCGHGIAVGSGAAPATDVQIVNCTSYGNYGWGLQYGNDTAPASGGLVLNSIFAENRLGGIALSRDSTCGYVAGFNLNPNGYGPETPRNVYDSQAAPRFADAANGNFRLLLSGPNGASPGIDAGSQPVAEFGLTGSATPGGAPDRGRVDLGFHYNADPAQDIALAPPLMPLYVRWSFAGESGLSREDALGSIGAAAEQAAAGITVIVGPGRYQESNISPRSRTQRSGRVIFFADSDGVATGDPPGAVLVDAGGSGAPAFLLNSACESVIDGFQVHGGESGIQVIAGSDRAWLRNNIIFSAAKRGIDVFDSSDVRLTNNLIYAANGGVQMFQSPLALLTNNTIYGNAFTGVLLQSGSYCGRLRYNVIEGNGENGTVVEERPAIVGWNVHPDLLQGMDRPPSDRTDSALLVDPDGGDGVLGNDGFADDLFFVAALSPAVDLAPPLAEDAGLAEHTTQSDLAPDSGRLDAGFHYAIPGVGRDPADALQRPAALDEEDGELCDELIASLTPTPTGNNGSGGGGGGGGGGGCAVTGAPRADGALPHLLIAAALWLLAARRPAPLARRSNG